MQHTLEQRLTDIVTPLASGLGLTIWGLELAAGPRSLVRIYVESEQGVDIDQCADLSRLIGLSLDVEDIIPGAYVLEVSSPGLERRYFTSAQLASARHELVDITLHEALPDFPGRRKFRGVLADVPDMADIPLSDDAEFVLDMEQTPGAPEEETRARFRFSQVKKAKRVHLLPEKTLPGKGPKKKTSPGKMVERQTASGDNGASHTE